MKKVGFSSLEPSSCTVSSFSWIFVPDIDSPDKWLSNDYRTAQSVFPFSCSMKIAKLSRVPVCAHLPALRMGAGGDFSAVR